MVLVQSTLAAQQCGWDQPLFWPLYEGQDPGVPWGVSLVLHSNTLLAPMFLYLNPHSCDLSLQPDLQTHPDPQFLPAVIHSEQTVTPHLFLLVLLLWKHEEKQIHNSNTPNLSSTYLPISLFNLSFTIIIKGCRQLCIFAPHYLYASDLCLFNGQGLLTTEVSVIIIFWLFIFSIFVTHSKATFLHMSTFLKSVLQLPSVNAVSH